MGNEVSSRSSRQRRPSVHVLPRRDPQVSLSLVDIRCGATVVQARLRDGAASPNKRLLFREAVGPLPAGCKCTPLGYAILARDAALLGVLLSAGADPNKTIGLPHRFDFAPLHLAAALGNAEAVRLLLAAGADPNAPLQAKRGTVTPPPAPAYSASPAAASAATSAATTNTTTPPPAPPPTTSPAALLRVNLCYTRTGDAPMHIVVDCAGGSAAPRSSCSASASGGDGSSAALEVLEALLSHERTNPNLQNTHRRTPLYKACKRRLAACVTLLVTHPRVSVNVGGPLFAAIMAESTELVRVLLQAGACATGSVRNVDGQSPLRYALTRHSVFFSNRAEIVALLVGAGAVVKPDMLTLASQNNWPKVLAMLQTAQGRSAGGTAGAGGRPNGVSEAPRAAATAAGSSPTQWAPPETSSRQSILVDAASSLYSLPSSLPSSSMPISNAAAEGNPSRQPAAAGGRSGDSGGYGSTAAAHSGGRGVSEAAKLLHASMRNPIGIFLVPVILPFVLLENLGEALASLSAFLNTLLYFMVGVAIFLAPMLTYFSYRAVQLVLRGLAFLSSRMAALSAPGDGAAADATGPVAGSSTNTSAGQLDAATTTVIALDTAAAAVANGGSSAGSSFAADLMAGNLSKEAKVLLLVTPAPDAMLPDPIGPDSSSGALPGSSLTDGLVSWPVLDSTASLSGVLEGPVGLEDQQQPQQLQQQQQGGGGQERSPEYRAQRTLEGGVQGPVFRDGDLRVGDDTTPESAPTVMSKDTLISVLQVLWRGYVGIFISLLAVVVALLVVQWAREMCETTLRYCLPKRSTVRAFLEERELQRRLTQGRGFKEPTYPPYYFLAAVLLRWIMGIPFCVLCALLAVCCAVNEASQVYDLYRVWLGHRDLPRPPEEGGEEAVAAATVTAAVPTDMASSPVEDAAIFPAAAAVAPTAAVGPAVTSAATAATGASGATAPSASNGSGGSGLDGMCCVCMNSRAVFGFVHRDVVHCCLCDPCEGELRRRGKLGSCLICKRPAENVAKVIAT